MELPSISTGRERLAAIDADLQPSPAQLPAEPIEGADRLGTPSGDKQCEYLKFFLIIKNLHVRNIQSGTGEIGARTGEEEG
jgi:hypothetical protein